MLNQRSGCIVHWFKIILLLILLILTFVYTIPWTLDHALNVNHSSIDLHAYWYAGHFMRQGVNPYIAMASDPTPDYWDPKIPGSGEPKSQSADEHAPKVPVDYLDGARIQDQPIAQTLIMPPVMTAPSVLLLGQIAWISWPNAKMAWMMINLILAAIIPWLAIRLLPDRLKMNLVDKLLIAFVFYNLFGLRRSIEVGQQTLMILTLLLGALLLLNKRWWIAGILLGIGLSKYSIALPIFLIILLMRQYRVVLISLAVQALSILVLTITTSGSILETITAYLKFASIYAYQFGVHISSRFAEFSKAPIGLNIMLIAVCAAVLILWIQRYKNARYLTRTLSNTNLILLSILTLVTLLVTYHRIHDLPVLISYLAPVYAVLVIPNVLAANRQVKFLAGLIFVISTTFLVFPTFLGRVSQLLGLPPTWVGWLGVAENITTFALAAMLGLSLAILFWLAEVRSNPMTEQLTANVGELTAD